MALTWGISMVVSGLASVFAGLVILLISRTNVNLLLAVEVNNGCTLCCFLLALLYMRPILFSLGRVNFYSYGFFTALGFMAGGAIVDYLAKRKRLVTSRHAEYFVIDTLLVSLVAGILVSRLSYSVLYSLIFQLEPLSLLGGGFTYYPGLDAGIAVFIYWIRRTETNILRWLDALMVGILAGTSLSELGGYLNDGQIVHLGALLGSAVIAGFAYRLFMAERKPGKTFFFSLFLLFLLYFFLGFWQQEKVAWAGLNLTQWVSLISLAGIYAAWKQTLTDKKS